MVKYDLVKELSRALNRNLTTGANPTRLYFLTHPGRGRKGDRKPGGEISFHHGVLTMDGGTTIGVMYDIQALEKAKISGESVYLPIDDDQLEYIRKHLIDKTTNRSKLGKRFRALFERLTTVVKRNPASNPIKELQKENESLKKELSFHKGSHADVVGLMAGQLPCPSNSIARLPSGMDWIAVYPDNGPRGPFLAIDLIEMNHLNDEGETSFTENQREQIRLIKDDRLIFRLIHGTVSMDRGDRISFEWEIIHQKGRIRDGRRGE